MIIHQDIALINQVTNNRGLIIICLYKYYRYIIYHKCLSTAHVVLCSSWEYVWKHEKNNYEHGYIYNYGTFINVNRNRHSVYVYKTCVHNKYVCVCVCTWFVLNFKQKFINIWSKILYTRMIYSSRYSISQ